MLKTRIKKRFPIAIQAVRFVRKQVARFESVDGKFFRIYANNLWGDSESVSGPGSSLFQTATVRAVLPGVIQQFGIKSMLDIPCGDFNWMKEVKLDVDRYIGGDIVKQLVRANDQKYRQQNLTFVEIDILKDPLPQVDLIFCRDCLVHFSFRDISSSLKNFKNSGSKYLLTTTFTSEKVNRDIDTGGWRRLNLCGDPINLPPPELVINEKCPNPKHPDKSLGLWKLADITQF